MYYFIICSLIWGTMSAFAMKHQHTHTTKHNHTIKGLAPIGLMADHTHSEGSLMFSYRLMQMNMKGLVEAESSKSIDNYFENTSYMMAPDEMKVQMHMLGLMYGITNNISLAVMSSYIKNEMRMIRRMGRESVTTTSEGLSDTDLNALFKIKEDDLSRFVVGFGFSLPTGSIDQMNNSQRLPYGMQLGSGSYGINIVVTYLRHIGSWSLGGQVRGKFFVNENSENYQQGNEYRSSIWLSKKVNDHFGFSARINQKNIDPLLSSESLTSNMSSRFDSAAQHGTRRFGVIGVEYRGAGFLKNNRFGIEYYIPIYENLSGYQLKSENNITFGWQKFF